MSVLLVRWLRESNGVLGMAPVMMRSASACILLSFLRLISVLIALIQILQQYVRIGLSNDCVIHPVASLRVQAQGRAYRPPALHEGGGGLSG
jgi:hypothetical protein